jgi:demethylmenaquinone methyltransferase/2-methoxy-6-polyprenyl-1,4-benzoquinol methylase
VREAEAQEREAAGARPAGATTEAAAAQGIQQMFDTIAPRYDLLNHLLSAGVDRWWWSRTARSVRAILARPEAVVLDLCCGTGDMTLALERYRQKDEAAVPMLAVDFSHAMLALGAAKFAGRKIVAIEADALHSIACCGRAGRLRFWISTSRVGCWGWGMRCISSMCCRGWAG